MQVRRLAVFDIELKPYIGALQRQRTHVEIFEHCYFPYYERLRQSEESRRLAWPILQKIREVLEILGDQLIWGCWDVLENAGPHQRSPLLSLGTGAETTVHQFVAASFSCNNSQIRS
ncbi:MAG TPA: hypothetical protein VGH55_05190 [Chthoniobacterales bacterium]|jgi:hypothetical protein